MHDKRDTAHALLRITVGVTLVVYGLGSSPALIPVAEIVLGVLIALGLFTPASVKAAGAAVLIVIAGSAFDGQRDLVAYNLSLAVAIFAVYYTADHNRWSIDGMWQRRNASAADVPTTMLRVHTSDDDLVVGVLPARRGERERLFVTRAADIPAAVAPATSHRPRRRQAM